MNEWWLYFRQPGPIKIQQRTHRTAKKAKKRSWLEYFDETNPHTKLVIQSERKRLFIVPNFVLLQKKRLVIDNINLKKTGQTAPIVMNGTKLKQKTDGNERFESPSVREGNPLVYGGKTCGSEVEWVSEWVNEWMNGWSSATVYYELTVEVLEDNKLACEMSWRRIYCAARTSSGKWIRGTCSVDKSPELRRFCETVCDYYQ